MIITEPDPLSSITAFSPGVDRVCSIGFEDNAPPWQNERLWQAAESTLHYLMRRHVHQWDQVKATADSIKGQIGSIDAMLDRLCEKTCVQCSAPCCLVADVSYDFRDLLFIHMTEQVMPAGQPRGTAHDVCRYLGATGCLISRFERPWICTWYICAEQKKYLTGLRETSRKQLLSAIEQVKMLRKQMEDFFIDIVAP